MLESSKGGRNVKSINLTVGKDQHDDPNIEILELLRERKNNPKRKDEHQDQRIATITKAFLTNRANAFASQWQKYGLDADDYINEAWIQISNNLDEFDPQKGEFAAWINRIASNRWHSMLREMKKHDCEDYETITDFEQKGRITTIFLEPTFEDPQAIFSQKEEREEEKNTVKILCRKVLEMVKNDKQLEEVCQAILAGCPPKPRHLAKKLETSVKDINNRMKRLRRLGKNLF